MAILCDKNTKLLVQGMGKTGQLHARLSIEYGTQIVGGVHPGRGGSLARMFTPDRETSISRPIDSIPSAT